MCIVVWEQKRDRHLEARSPSRFCSVVSAVESVRGWETTRTTVRAQERLLQSTVFFRAFILSCFRDPLGDFAVREMKLKTDHEKEKVKLDRTRAKSGELR